MKKRGGVSIADWIHEKAGAGIVLLVVVGMLSVSAGIVIVPVRMTASPAYLVNCVTSGSAAEDFPCRGHGCGCISADMCRTACCCVKPTADPSEPACHADASTTAIQSTPNIDGSTADPAPDDTQAVWVMRSASCAGLAAQWVLESFNAMPPTAATTLHRYDLTFEIPPAVDGNAPSGQLTTDPPPPRRV